MKTAFLVSALVSLGTSSIVFAHDEGHGPKISDTGKYGGLVSPVIKESEAKMGSRAKMVHKAEMARSADGTVRIYLYDETMKPLDTKEFDKTATGHLGTRVKGKLREIAFPLELKEGAYVGKMPKPERKPYDIDVHMKKSGTALLSAFDNLD